LLRPNIIRIPNTGAASLRPYNGEPTSDSPAKAIRRSAPQGFAVGETH
jgi:hypothetical protein